MSRPTMPRGDVRATIVDAAERLLRTEGAHAVTTRAVAQAAGVQAPSIYRLFGDKDGLIDAVAEQVMARYVAEKTVAADAEARANRDPRADLRTAWRSAIEFGLANPDLFVLLNEPERAARSPAATAGTDVLRARIRRLASAGLLRVDEERALDMIRAAGTGTVLALLSRPPDERDLALADTMIDTVAAGILVDGPATVDVDGRGTVAPVVVAFRTVLPDLPTLSGAERALMTEWVDRSLVDLRDVDTSRRP